MNTKNSYYNPFESMSFSNERCFLCGKKLNIKTNEHVFPKWLLDEFDLWDQKITLLNRTKITYRQLRIPCCKKCNNVYLSKIEKRVKKKYFEGFESFLKTKELLIYQWVGKIFYGLLFRELSLLIDQSTPEKGNITSSEILEKFKTLHGFLQSIRTAFKFENFKPWSIFILNLQIDNKLSKFDYHDSLFLLTFSIRMGNIGIIACLGDNGAQKDIFQNYWKKIQKIKLHPIQFDELYAKVTYKSSLMNRTPKYITIMPENEDGLTSVIASPLQGLSSKPIYDEWEQKEYAKYLASLLGIYKLSFNDIYKEPNLVMSFINDEKDRIKVFNHKGEIIKYI